MRDRARNTLNQARRLTLTPTRQVLKDTIGATDKDDLYGVTIGDRSTLNVQLTNIGKRADVDLELYALKGNPAAVLRRIGRINFSSLKRADIRRNLTRLGRSARRGRADEELDLALTAGTYYLRVYPRTGNTAYTLSLFATPDITSGSPPPPGGSGGSGGSGGGSTPPPIDLRTWNIIGDGQFTGTPAPNVVLSNAFTGGDPGDIGNPNVSGVAPLSVFGTGNQNFAAAIGLTSVQLNQGLGIGSTVNPPAVGYREGSAIRNPNVVANVGDEFRFDWSFLQKDAPDLGFVKVNSTLFRLDGASPFKFTFPATGWYDIAIGVVDVNDFSRSSVLQVTNANLFR